MAQLTGPIRVLAVDDHALMREGLGLILSSHDDIVLTASAKTGHEAVELFTRHRPDITLMDLGLPDMTGFDAMKLILKIDPKARIIVLTVQEGDEDIYRSLKNGAAAYLLKDTLSDDLVRVIRDVFAGQRPMLPSVATKLSVRALSPGLTPREVEIMRLIAKGRRNKEISFELGISEDTVQGHLKSIFIKLEVNDRTAALAVAVRRGFVRL